MTIKADPNPTARDACIDSSPWWRFWSRSRHQWRRFNDAGWMRCERCNLRRTLLWAFPETWEYYRPPSPEDSYDRWAEAVG